MMKLAIHHYQFHYPIPIREKPQVEKNQIRLQRFHPSVFQVIYALNKKTRSMKEFVLMWKSRESTKEANSIPLVETFLIHLGEQKKNRKHESEYLHTKR